MRKVIPPRVSAVSLPGGYALLDNYTTINIVTMYDCDGELTENIDSAVSCVAGQYGGLWYAINLLEITHIKHN